MSILKQAQEAKLTPEEIQELISILETVIPKIKKRADFYKSTAILNDNLRESFIRNKLDDAVMFNKDNNKDYEQELRKGLELLESSKQKLETFINTIADIKIE